jgi:aspartyl-tRNA(Asn)/glutamyl-tRNA(Gln) amidotransferase subunit A
LRDLPAISSTAEIETIMPGPSAPRKKAGSLCPAGAQDLSGIDLIFCQMRLPAMSSMSHPTLAELAEDLASGRTTSRKLVEACLERIADPAGEGSRALISVDSAGARAAAEAMDGRRTAGKAPTPFAGIPISIKDLADIEGQVTTAGSRALADHAPAKSDAPVVARLRHAGLIMIGRANMTEFAYSGLGINPHYGTPLSPYDRVSKRIPGGSSSGVAVSVADGMAHGGLGTDTGGSCRIPAAFCGIVGYKPTASRVPTDGVVPLSTTLDSIGPLARSVACCAALDAIMAGEPLSELQPARLSGLRLLVPENFALDQLDVHVSAAFDRALSRLSAAGVRITRTAFPLLDRVPRLVRKGGFAASESYAWHRPLLETKQRMYDPHVLNRILRGAEQSAADYIDLLSARRAAVADFRTAMLDYDALAMPTTPIIPPRLAELETDEEYARLNLLILRNTLVINLLDGCSISLPMSPAGAPPCGFMLSAPAQSDHRLFAIAAALEDKLTLP